MNDKTPLLYLRSTWPLKIDPGLFFGFLDMPLLSFFSATLSAVGHYASKNHTVQKHFRSKHTESNSYGVVSVQDSGHDTRCGIHRSKIELITGCGA